MSIKFRAYYAKKKVPASFRHNILFAVSETQSFCNFDDSAGTVGIEILALLLFSSFPFVPFSYGIETEEGIFNRIIKRNSRLPAKNSQRFTTYSDYQSDMIITILEGENPMGKENSLLQKFKIYGIPPAPKGVPQIEVTFNIDADGLLTVSVKDKLTGNYNKIRGFFV